MAGWRGGGRGREKGGKKCFHQVDELYNLSLFLSNFLETRVGAVKITVLLQEHLTRLLLEEDPFF